MVTTRKAAKTKRAGLALAALAAAKFKRSVFTDPISLKTVGKSRGVRINKQWYNAKGLLRAMNQYGLNKVPHSRRPLDHPYTMQNIRHASNWADNRDEKPSRIRAARKLGAVAGSVLSLPQAEREAAVAGLGANVHVNASNVDGARQYRVSLPQVPSVLLYLRASGGNITEAKLVFSGFAVTAERKPGTISLTTHWCDIDVFDAYVQGLRSKSTVRVTTPRLAYRPGYGTEPMHVKTNGMPWMPRKKVEKRPRGSLWAGEWWK